MIRLFDIVACLKDILFDFGAASLHAIMCAVLCRVQDALAGQAGSTANATKELSNLLAGLSLQPETDNSKAAGPAALGGQNASSGVVSSMHHTPEDRRQLQQQALLQVHGMNLN